MTESTDESRSTFTIRHRIIDFQNPSETGFRLKIAARLFEQVRSKEDRFYKNCANSNDYGRCEPEKIQIQCFGGRNTVSLTGLAENDSTGSAQAILMIGNAFLGDNNDFLDRTIIQAKLPTGMSKPSTETEGSSQHPPSDGPSSSEATPEQKEPEDANKQSKSPWLHRVRNTFNRIRQFLVYCGDIPRFDPYPYLLLLSNPFEGWLRCYRHDRHSERYIPINWFDEIDIDRALGCQVHYDNIDSDIYKRKLLQWPWRWRWVTGEQPWPLIGTQVIPGDPLLDIGEQNRRYTRLRAVIIVSIVLLLAAFILPPYLFEHEIRVQWVSLNQEELSLIPQLEPLKTAGITLQFKDNLLNTQSQLDCAMVQYLAGVDPPDAICGVVTQRFVDQRLQLNGKNHLLLHVKIEKRYQMLVDYWQNKQKQEGKPHRLTPIPEPELLKDLGLLLKQGPQGQEKVIGSSQELTNFVPRNKVIEQTRLLNLFTQERQPRVPGWRSLPQWQDLQNTGLSVYTNKYPSKPVNINNEDEYHCYLVQSIIGVGVDRPCETGTLKQLENYIRKNTISVDPANNSQILAAIQYWDGKQDSEESPWLASPRLDALSQLNLSIRISDATTDTGSTHSESKHLPVSDNDSLRCLIIQKIVGQPQTGQCDEATRGLVQERINREGIKTEQTGIPNLEQLQEFGLSIFSGEQRLPDMESIRCAIVRGIVGAQGIGCDLETERTIDDYIQQQINNDSTARYEWRNYESLGSLIHESRNKLLLQWSETHKNNRKSLIQTLLSNDIPTIAELGSLGLTAIDRERVIENDCELRRLLNTEQNAKTDECKKAGSADPNDKQAE